MAALRAAHPDVNIKEEVSEYYIASDIRAIYSGMVIAVNYEDWSIFRDVTIAQMAILLVDLAHTCNLAKLKKNKRGVKKHLKRTGVMSNKTFWKEIVEGLQLQRRWSFFKNEADHAIIIGLSDLSLELANEFKRKPLLGGTFMGFFDDRWPERLSKKWQQPEELLGSITSAVEFVKANNVQHIYIALPMSAQPRILLLLDELRDTTASIYFVPDLFLFDLIQANVKSIKGIPIVAVCQSPFVGTNATTKRISDVVLSLLILLLMTPLMLLITLGVKLSSPGSVLFKQHRYGLDGRKIIVYKFRSMTVTEDGQQVNQATRSDPRVTRFGGFLRKTSLDELPQFINVLQGHMSIVGPRPHAISHNEMYRSQIKGYMIRHKVKPGITGLAQINGCRGETDTVDKMQHRIDFDLNYLRNWSLFLDLLIIFKTIGVIIKDKNAY
jgi:putative colanic acid biosynthesis UDP-glucose lipid carrier transferase